MRYGRIAYVMLGLIIWLGLGAQTTGLLAGQATADDTSTTIFSPDFRTLTVNIEGDRLAPPILTLDGPQRLVIGFDELTDERSYLRYSIYHCDASWRPSQLVDSEVFDGFNIADVEDYGFSRATTMHYVHYSIALPNREFQFRISGNYLLQVYREDEPEDILLQVRFMVQEGEIGVGGSITSRTDVDYNDASQQLALEVETRRMRIRDPNTDLRVVVTQNGRPDTRRIFSRPSRLMGSKIIYEHMPSLIYPAGNEYHRFETVNNLYPGIGEDHIEYHSPWYHHVLNLDKPRADREYIFDSTQNGRYFIREYNADDSDVEADYVMVHFSLDMLPMPDADIYLDGDFLQRKLDDSSKMEYNPSTGRYERAMMLKQGAYNYSYLAWPRGVAPGQRPPAGYMSPTAPVDGDHYQTVNEYLVLVYYREPGSRFDRLLGSGLLRFQ